MIIDVHAHYYPQEYLTAMGHSEVPGLATAPLGTQSMDDRLELLERIGIDIQVLSVSQVQPYLADVAQATNAATLANDIFANICNQHSETFLAFGALPLPHVDAAMAELARCLDDLSFVGVTLGCSVAGRQLDDPIFEPVFAELDRRKTVVFLHPVGKAFVGDVGSFGLDWLVGAPFEDTIAALRLAFSGLADRFPNIEFIVPHLGGTIPFLMSRIFRTTGTRANALHRMWYDTVAGAEAALPCACQAYGSERLLFGTDYPFADEKGFTRRLTYLGDAGLGEEEVRNIQGNRAAELLGIATD